MKKIFFLAVMLCWLGAQAQNRVKIGADGVEVKSGDEKVKVDPYGVEVNDGTGKKVKVTAPQVEIESKSEKADKDGSLGLSEAPPKGLKKMKAIVCQGNQNREYTRVLIAGAKDGVLVQGNCDITLRDSHIDVDGYGVNVQGNGHVKLVRTFVRGKKGAVMIMGNGDVSASASTLIGKIQQLGNGEFNDQGNNTIRQQ